MTTHLRKKLMKLEKIINNLIIPVGCWDGVEFFIKKNKITGMDINSAEPHFWSNENKAIDWINIVSSSFTKWNNKVYFSEDCFNAMEKWCSFQRD